MNSIQDIILESEYNVLMALSEYYEKQIMFETVIMEAGVTTITPERITPNNENLIQRFIEWCRKMVDNIKSKFNKVPPRTPVPPPLVKPSQTIIQAANEYSDAATNATFTPEKIAKIMEEVNRKVQMTPEQAEAFKQRLAERTPQADSSLTIDNLQEATNKVNQAIDQINSNIQQMENVAGQAQDAVNQNKLKAEKEKLKTGGGILKRLSNLISSMTSSVSSIEGEPISDIKGYTQNIIDTIKNAKTPQEAQNTYDKAVATYDKLTKFYKDKLKNGPVTKQEADYCKSQIQKVQQMSNNVTQSYKGNLAQSPKGGIIGDPMPDPASYFQKATEDIKKAGNYDDLSDIWNNVIREKRAAIDWYKSKSEDNNTSANERKFCKDKMKIVEQWYKGYADTAKQLSDAFVDQMRNGQNGGGAQNTNEPTPEQQQQNGRKISPEAQNILNDINGGQNPPQQSTQQQQTQNNPQPTQQPTPQQTQQQQKQNNPPQQNPAPEQQPQPAPQPNPAPQNNQQQNPTPEQQPQQQTQNGQQQNVETNNANGISGAQLFDLINNNLSRNGHRRVWNNTAQLLQFSTTGSLISDSEGNVYPYATEPYQVRINTLNPQLFDVVGKGSLDDSTLIVPAKFNDHGDIISKGAIKQGAASSQANGAQPTQNNPQPAPEQQQQTQQNNANTGGMPATQVIDLVKDWINRGGAAGYQRRVYNTGTKRTEFTMNPERHPFYYVYNSNDGSVYPAINTTPVKSASYAALFDCRTNRIENDTPITPAKIDQSGNILQKGVIG